MAGLQESVGDNCSRLRPMRRALWVVAGSGKLFSLLDVRVQVLSLVFQIVNSLLAVSALSPNPGLAMLSLLDFC